MSIFPKIDDLRNNRFKSSNAIPPEKKIQPKKKENIKIAEPPSISNIDIDQYKDILHHIEENKNLTVDEIIKIGLGGKETARGDLFEGMKKGLENMFAIKTMLPLINKKEKEAEEVEENESNDEPDYLSMLPFLNNSNKGGINMEGIDPSLLLLFNNANRKGNSNMGLLFFLFNMMKMQTANQSQNVNQTNPVTGQSTNNIMSPDMLKAMYEEIKNAMQSQQQNQVDPMTIAMLEVLKNNNNNSNKGNDTNTQMMLELIKLIATSNQPKGNDNALLVEMVKMMNESNKAQQAATIDSVKQMFSHIYSAIPRKEDKDPMDSFIKTLQVARSIEGEGRTRTAEELKHDLELQKLKMDLMMRKEEKEQEKELRMAEINKGDRVFGMVENVLQSGVPQMIAGVAQNFVEKSMANKQSNQSGMGLHKRGGMSLDPSDLDDL